MLLELNSDPPDLIQKTSILSAARSIAPHTDLTRQQFRLFIYRHHDVVIAGYTIDNVYRVDYLLNDVILCVVGPAKQCKQSSELHQTSFTKPAF